MIFDVEVTVGSLPGVADPEGRTIERALTALGFDGVDSVRVGKVITFRLDADDENEARAKVQEMSDRLLANPVIERYEFELASARA